MISVLKVCVQGKKIIFKGKEKNLERKNILDNVSTLGRSLVLELTERGHEN